MNPAGKNQQIGNDSLMNQEQLPVCNPKII
jgi:hypothetical protein